MKSWINKNWELRIQALTDSTFHLFRFLPGEIPGSALNRYGFLKENWPTIKMEEKQRGNNITLKTEKVMFSLKREEEPNISITDRKGGMFLKGEIKLLPGNGFTLEFNLAKEEKLFGLGDQSRERIEHRGNKADMWIKPVISYIPIPFLMSSKGYGIFINTTFRHSLDIGKTDKNKLKIFIPEGKLDLYFI